MSLNKTLEEIPLFSTEKVDKLLSDRSLNPWRQRHQKVLLAGQVFKLQKMVDDLAAKNKQLSSPKKIIKSLTK